LWASPANPGAAELGGELTAAFAGLTVSTVADGSSSAPGRRPAAVTHMLLYLNQDTWLEDDGERLAEQIKQAREDKLKIVMAHESDPERGGCEFNRFFETTPQELINDGLYRDLARTFLPGVYREAPQRAGVSSVHVKRSDVGLGCRSRCRACFWQRTWARRR